MNKCMLLLIVSWFFFVKVVLSKEDKLISPCPDVFQYDQNQTETDRWYGTVIVTSQQDLMGVWFRVVLDSESIQLGNWFGEVETRDNKHGYLIKSPNYKLVADTPLKIRFYVKYDPKKPVPKVQSFRLNAVVKCPEGAEVIELPVVTGQLFTNKPDVSSSNQSPLLDPSKCGTIDGQSDNEFPWYAAIYRTSDIDLSYLCGATLISSQHLITSANCITKGTSRDAVESDKLVVYLGKYLVSDWQSPQLQTKKVENIIVHPQYNPKDAAHDLAVLKLVEPIDFTSSVRPLCLPQQANSPTILTDQTGVVAGYDQLGRSLIDSPLRILPQEDCTKQFPEYTAGFKERSAFCGGFSNGTCNRNSGSGFALANPTSNAQLEIKGVVSIGDQTKCDSSSSKAILTDIHFHLDFIYKNLKL